MIINDNYKTMNAKMKQDKFTMLVEDINRGLYIITPEDTTTGGCRSIFGLTAKMSANMQRAYDLEREKQRSFNRSYKVGPLNMIFDSQSANGYLKIILSNVSFHLEWYKNYQSVNFNDLNVKIAATQELISEFKVDTEKESLRFIFWSLFAVSVDKTDYEEKVSLIADFAHMLEIDEKTIRDITQIIKVIFGEEEERFEFQTDEIPSLFSGVLNNTTGDKVEQSKDFVNQILGRV